MKLQSGNIWSLKRLDKLHSDMENRDGKRFKQQLVHTLMVLLEVQKDFCQSNRALSEVHKEP